MKPFKKIIMVDALIGNDYSLCLSKGIASAGADLKLVVPENKPLVSEYNFCIWKLLPSKDPKERKTKKIASYLKYYIKLLFEIIKVKPDAVHFQFFRTKIDFIYFILLKIFTKNLVLTAHNVLPHEKGKSDYYLHKFIYKAADKIIVHSDSIKKKLLKNFPVESNKVHVIPHGNFDNYLPATELAKDSARKKLGYNSFDKVILFFGYIREYKGLDILLDAYNKIKETDIKLLIAGAPYSPQLKEKYEQKIKDINCINVKTYFDFIPNDEVANYFLASDVVVLPYKAIDHSGIIHLAYTFGKPIIASKVGDFEDMIEHKKTGYLFEINSVDELAKYLVDIFKDPAEPERLGARAKQLSETIYSWDKIGSATYNLY